MSVDNPDRAPVVSFGPSRPLGWAAVAGALAAAGGAALSGDAAGRLLLIGAAILLACVAAGDLLFNPRLIANQAGLTLRTPAQRGTLSWSAISSIRVDERTRLGLASRTLEIDAGELLVVLSRHALGADPRDVLPMLAAFHQV
jgi:hypothetical protein